MNWMFSMCLMGIDLGLATMVRVQITLYPNQALFYEGILRLMKSEGELK